MRIKMMLKHANAICYSGYREGQCPRAGVYPSYQQVKEDLLLLADDWKLLRLYDCGPHAELVLSVIEQEQLSFNIMLGADIGAEVSNPNCPWGAEFSEQKLRENSLSNEQQIEKLIEFANKYPNIISSVSIGNEASVDWTDHLVPVERLIYYVKKIKAVIAQPVTFCENYVPWTTKLAPLVAELDFISIHTYPAWEYQSLESALAYTKENYYSVANAYPDKQTVITEAGWTTQSNGRGIETWNASEEHQAQYYQELMAWTNQEQILTFIFEAFDEPWKGSGHPQEPEKHWGLYFENRQPKKVLQNQYDRKKIA